MVRGYGRGPYWGEDRKPRLTRILPWEPPMGVLPIDALIAPALNRESLESLRAFRKALFKSSAPPCK